MRAHVCRAICPVPPPSLRRGLTLTASLPETTAARNAPLPKSLASVASAALSDIYTHT